MINEDDLTNLEKVIKNRTTLLYYKEEESEAKQNLLVLTALNEYCRQKTGQPLSSDIGNEWRNNYSLTLEKELLALIGEYREAHY